MFTEHGSIVKVFTHKNVYSSRKNSSINLIVNACKLFCFWHDCVDIPILLKSFIFKSTSFSPLEVNMYNEDLALRSTWSTRMIILKNLQGVEELPNEKKIFPLQISVWNLFSFLWYGL